jgi:hypothetical protein
MSCGLRMFYALAEKGKSPNSDMHYTQDSAHIESEDFEFNIRFVRHAIKRASR